MIAGIKWRARRVIDNVRSLGTPDALRGFDKLHLGAGSRQIEGWANVDISGRDNIIWDLRKTLPVEPHSFRLVYTEHFIEHITRDQALRLLKGARYALAHGGKLRISTPDLATLIRYYNRGEVMEMPHGPWFPATLCRMVNEGMREWGHTFVYDEAELRDLLAEAGFGSIERMKWGESAVTELRGLETRPDFDDLILEAHP